MRMRSAGLPLLFILGLFAAPLEGQTVRLASVLGRADEMIQ